MQADVSGIRTALSSIENDWKSREEALTSLVQALNNPAEIKSALELANSLPELIAYQFADLRSGIVKLASDAVTAYARFGSDQPEEVLQSFADRLLQEPAYYKALGSGNKVIAKHAQNALRALTLNSCLSLEILKKVYAAQKATKINFIRENVAEAFSSFIAYAISPPKKLVSSGIVAPSLTHVISDVQIETENLSKTAMPMLSSAIPDALVIEGVSPLQITEVIAKPSSNDIDLQVLTQKIKEENFDYLKTVCEAFLRDSSPHVRNSGKEIKAKIVKIQELFLSRIETNASVFSHDPQEEHEGLGGFDGSNTTAMVIEKNYGSDLGATKSTGPGGMTFGKQTFSKALPLEERILKLLRADTKSAKDQTEELEKLVLSATAPLVFTCDQYIEILALFNTAKNLNFKASLTRVLTKSDVSHFQFAILDHLLKEKMLKRTGFAPIAKYITDRVSFEVCLNMMITRTYEELIGILAKSYCPRKLQKVLTTHEIEAQDIASAFQRNYLKADAAGLLNPTQYKAQNLGLMQKILSDRENRAFFEGVDWAPTFLEKLRESDVGIAPAKTEASGAPVPKTLDLRGLAHELSTYTAEDQIVRKMEQIVGTVPLPEQQKGEIVHLMSVLARLRKDGLTIGHGHEMAGPLSASTHALAQTQDSGSLTLAFLLVWGATPVAINPDSADFLLTLVSDIQNAASPSLSQATAEALVALGSLGPFGVSCLFELLLQQLPADRILAITTLLKYISCSILGSKEEPNFILQINQSFGAFATATTHLLDHPAPEVQTAAAETAAAIRKFANPISFAAFVQTLSPEKQSKVAIYG